MSAYYLKLQAEEVATAERYRQKLSIINNVDPFALDDSMFSAKPCDFPPVTSIDMCYLVLTTSFFTKEQMKAYKSLNAFKYFEAGFVSTCAALKINEKIVVVGKVSNRDLVDFLTGSTYKGKWSPVNMDSVGSFMLPHGVVYRGQMKDGQFHGRGILMYPSGQIILGEWHEGEMTAWKSERRNIEQCNLSTYCKQPDRRFFTTLNTELLPPGMEHLTNEQPTKEIPNGCYDVGDGFFNPKTLWVHSYKDFELPQYMPSSEMPSVDENILEDDDSFIRRMPFVRIYKSCDWIKKHCRKAWDEPSGYIPEHYEYWCSGRRAQQKKLNMRLTKEGGKFVTEAVLCDRLLKDFETVAERRKKIREETKKLSYSQGNVEQGKVSN